MWLHVLVGWPGLAAYCWQNHSVIVSQISVYSSAYTHAFLQYCFPFHSIFTMFLIVPTFPWWNSFENSWIPGLLFLYSHIPWELHHDFYLLKTGLEVSMAFHLHSTNCVSPLAQIMILELNQLRLISLHFSCFHFIFDIK